MSQSFMKPRATLRRPKEKTIGLTLTHFLALPNLRGGRSTTSIQFSKNRHSSFRLRARCALPPLLAAGSSRKPERPSRVKSFFRSRRFFLSDPFGPSPLRLDCYRRGDRESACSDPVGQEPILTRHHYFFQTPGNTGVAGEGERCRGRQGARIAGAARAFAAYS